MINIKDRINNDFMYHKPDDSAIKLHERSRALCLGLAKELVDICPESRELSIAITHIENAMFWANAAIARNHLWSD